MHAPPRSRPVTQTRINTFFPPYPSQAFDRFCRAVIERRRVPYSVYLAITGRCPYRCPHCSYAGRGHVIHTDPRAAGFIPADLSDPGVPVSRPAGGNAHTQTEQTDRVKLDGSPDPSAFRELPRDLTLDLIQQIKGLGTATIGFTGGEPLLRHDLEDFIAAAGPEMVAVVFTTGHGLDRNRAERLAEAGTSCVTLGIESADADEHDTIRKICGSFAQAESAARACREAGLYLAMSTIATRERIASGALERMYDLGRRWGAGEFRILAPVATGAWRGCGTVMLTAEERRRLIEFHADHNRRHDGPAVNSFAYLESEDLFGCGAGFHHLFIDALGEVCPCDLTPLSFGNAAREPLAAIWQRMAEHFPRPRRGCLMGEIGPCLACHDGPLPIPPDRSAELCRPPSPNALLPEGYRRLLK